MSLHPPSAASNALPDFTLKGREVIILSAMLGDGRHDQMLTEQQTRELAKMLGVTRERARQITYRMLSRIRGTAAVNTRELDDDGPPYGDVVAHERG